MVILVLAVLAPGVALCCWRMVVGAVAARPVSDRLRYAVGRADAPAVHDFSRSDFALLERLFTAAGALGGSSRSAILIRVYHQAVHGIGALLPGLMPWSEREMNMCARYLAARIDRSLASNAACSRRVGSL